MKPVFRDLHRSENAPARAQVPLKVPPQAPLKVPLNAQLAQVVQRRAAHRRNFLACKDVRANAISPSERTLSGFERKAMAGSGDPAIIGEFVVARFIGPKSSGRLKSATTNFNSRLKAELRTVSHLQQLPRFVLAGGGAAEFAGRDLGQRGQVQPAVGFTGLREGFGHGAVELLGMQGAVFTASVLEQQLKHLPRVAAIFAIGGSAGAARIWSLPRIASSVAASSCLVDGFFFSMRASGSG